MEDEDHQEHAVDWKIDRHGVADLFEAQRPTSAERPLLLIIAWLASRGMRSLR